jgi:hypothetical protein
MVRTPRVAPFLAALTVAACGSASVNRAADSPVPTVRRALTAVSHRPFDVTFREDARLRVSGVPRARASGLEAALRSAGLSETGVVHFISLRHFGARLSSSSTGTIYAKVIGGRFQVSRDGVKYRAAKPVERRVLTGFAQSGFSFVNESARDVEDEGPRMVNGIAVEEYTSSFPGAAVSARIDPLVKLPPHTSIGNGTTTLDIDRASGLPVHISDVVLFTTDLAAIRPGLTGRLITDLTNSRTFNFDPPR